MQSKKDKIWAQALKIISVRPHSAFMLKEKLSKEFPEESFIINQALDEMKNLQLISDRRYTELLIQHLTHRPIGRQKLKNEAHKRGIDSDLLAEVLMNTGYNEEKMAQQAFDQKSKILNESDPRKKKQKIMNFLKNRGFTNSVIYKVVLD